MKIPTFGLTYTCFCLGPLSSFPLFFYLFFMWVCTMSTDTHRSQERVSDPGAGVTGGGDPPYMSTGH